MIIGLSINSILKFKRFKVAAAELKVVLNIDLELKFRKIVEHALL